MSAARATCWASRRRCSPSASCARPTSKKLGLGYVHNLSKRTAVFATLAQVRNSGGATLSLYGSTTAANQKSTAYEAGLRHNF